jgi:hypothetical protein
VAHTCNPSYSTGRDQKDCDSRPAQAKQFVRQVGTCHPGDGGKLKIVGSRSRLARAKIEFLAPKKPEQKMTGGMTQVVAYHLTTAKP